MPEPSLITKPSRSRSNGREACSGSSLRFVLRACSWQNPASDSGVIPASVPPAIATSTRPSRIRRQASPMASLDDAQAVTTQKQGPLAWNRIAMLPATSFMIIMGTNSGCTALGPRSMSLRSVFSRVSTPPMPLPMITASRSGSTCPAARPACAMASTPATIAYCVNRSMRRASFDSITFSGAKSFSSPAIFEGKSDTSNRVIRPMPFSPALMRCQESWTLLPRGFTVPRPVTTTLRPIASPPAVTSTARRRRGSPAP